MRRKTNQKEMKRGGKRRKTKDREGMRIKENLKEKEGGE